MNPSNAQARVTALLAELIDLTVTTAEAAALRGVQPTAIHQATWRGSLTPLDLPVGRRFLRAEVLGGESE